MNKKSYSVVLAIALMLVFSAFSNTNAEIIKATADDDYAYFEIYDEENPMDPIEVMAYDWMGNYRNFRKGVAVPRAYINNLVGPKYFKVRLPEDGCLNYEGFSTDWVTYGYYNGVKISQKTINSINGGNTKKAESTVKSGESKSNSKKQQPKSLVNFDFAVTEVGMVCRGDTCNIDGTCDEAGGENHANCPADCKCDRDNVCDEADGENAQNCPSDCEDDDDWDGASCAILSIIKTGESGDMVTYQITLAGGVGGFGQMNHDTAWVVMPVNNRVITITSLKSTPEYRRFIEFSLYEGTYLGDDSMWIDPTWCPTWLYKQFPEKEFWHHRFELL